MNDYSHFWSSFNLIDFLSNLMIVFNKILVLVQDVFDNINSIFNYAFDSITSLSHSLTSNSGIFSLIASVYNTVPDIYRNVFIFSFTVSVIFIMARKMG